MKNILLIIIAFGTILNADFRRDSDRSTVIDDVNNLEWIDAQKDGNGRNTWVNAIKYCEKLNFAGEEDWRLPNINEVMTLADYAKTGIVLNSKFKYNRISYYYWSSTKVTGNDTDFWSLKLDHGSTFNAHKSKAYYSRCVRNAL